MIIYYRMDGGEILSVNVAESNLDDLELIAKRCGYDYWVSEGLDESDCPLELTILSSIEGEPIARFSLEVEVEPNFRILKLEN